MSSHEHAGLITGTNAEKDSVLRWSSELLMQPSGKEKDISVQRLKSMRNWLSALDEMVIYEM